MGDTPHPMERSEIIDSSRTFAVQNFELLLSLLGANQARNRRVDRFRVAGPSAKMQGSGESPNSGGSRNLHPQGLVIPYYLCCHFQRRPMARYISQGLSGLATVLLDVLALQQSTARC